MPGTKGMTHNNNIANSNKEAELHNFCRNEWSPNPACNCSFCTTLIQSGTFRTAALSKFFMKPQDQC